MCKRVLKEETSENEEIPFYKISTFGGKADTFISRTLYNKYRDKFSFPNKGDILISAAGTIGKTVIYDGEPGYFQDSNIVWINNDESKVTNSYLYYFFQTKPWLTTNGSTITRIYNDNLREIQLTVPVSLTEQKKIASVLSALDAKIELNNRINAELEAMAKTLYDYWFVQFDFPNEQGIPYKTSGGKMVWDEQLKREIPEGWKVGTASDLFIFNPSLSLKKGAISSYIDMNALPTDGFMTKEVQIKEFNGGVKFQNGDVTVARITPCLENGKTGLITLLKEGEIGFGSTEFIVLRGKDMKLSCFAAFLSRSELFRKYSIANMLGTSGRKRVEASKLGEFSMVIPPLDILEKFEKIVDPIFEKETLNTKENQHLSSLRDWLLPMLMNGQVTVGEKEKVVYKAEEELGMAAEPGGEKL